jgi:hypothetical protein
MRAVLCVLLAVAAGCGIKKKEEPPDVQLELGPGGVLVPVGSQPSHVVGMDYTMLWDPDGREKPDPAEAVKKFMAARYFAKHHTDLLAPAIVGAGANPLPGGLHTVVMPSALTVVYPEVAKGIEAKKDRLVLSSAPGMGSVDASTSGTGASTRLRVLRVKDGTDDELRTRFDDYLARLEITVMGAGVTLVAHQRGGLRSTGALSDIRYESPHRTGFVRSVVVRGYAESDEEFTRMILAENSTGVSGGQADFVKKMLAAEKGPYLVVFVKEQKR